MGRKGGGRSLGTARAVHRVLAHLAQRPDGVTVNEVAVVLGKSSWTARYLLNSLLQEGFAERVPRSARIRLAGRGVVIAGRPPDRAVSLGSAPAPPPTGDPGGQDLREALEELSLRTRQRGYLALLDQDVPTVADVVGKRGLPAMNGIRPALVREAHALAVGKAIIAHLPRAAVDAYVEQCGLPGFTPPRSPTSRGCSGSWRGCAPLVTPWTGRSSRRGSAASPRRCSGPGAASWGPSVSRCPRGGSRRRAVSSPGSSGLWPARSHPAGRAPGSPASPGRGWGAPRPAEPSSG